MSKVAFLLTTTPWNDRRQLIRQAPALKDAGHEVVYIAGFPGDYNKGLFDCENLTSRQRKLSRVTGALNLFFRVIRIKPDVIQMCSIEQLPLGIFLKIFTKIKVVYDCREDMAPSLLVHRDGISKPVRWLLYYMVNILELCAAKLFDGLVTADPFVFEKKAGMPDTRKMVFYNAAQLRDFKANYSALESREFDLVVMGSMSPRTGVLDVITAIGELYNECIPVRLLLLGEPDSSVTGEMNDLFNKYQIHDLVKVTGKIPHQKVPDVLAKAKIGVVPLLDYEKFRNNIACKAFEYMACGMPCICSDLRPQRVFIEDSVNGRFYKPGDVEALKIIIPDMLSRKRDLQRMGERNRNLVEEKWNAEIFEEELKGFYKHILNLPNRIFG